MKKREVTLTVIRPGEATPKDAWELWTVSERILMMWPLACDAWTFKGDFDAESRLQRHVTRVIRRGR